MELGLYIAVLYLLPNWRSFVVLIGGSFCLLDTFGRGFYLLIFETSLGAGGSPVFLCDTVDGL